MSFLSGNEASIWTNVAASDSALTEDTDKPLDFDQWLATFDFEEPKPRKSRRRLRRKKRKGHESSLLPPGIHGLPNPTHSYKDYRHKFRPSGLPPSAQFASNSTLCIKRDIDLGFHPDRVLAIDCEMVGVGDDGRRSIVARVSIVDWHGNVVMDAYVKPTEPVTDYRSFVSGICAEDVHSPHAMEFQACRSLVQGLIQGKILVGHGLANDLMVLRLSHPWLQLRDSATYGPFLKPGLRSHRLKHLAEQLLGLKIQQDDKPHSPIEDALAAMELYKSVQLEWDSAIRWKRNSVLQCPLHQLTA